MKNLLSENFRNNSHWITGEIHDVLIDKDGNRTPLLVDHNLVVNSCSKLIAAFIKGDESVGVKYWAIGGYNSDDLADEKNKPDINFGSTAASNDERLVNEIYRQEIAPENISFVDDQNNVVETISNKIKITVIVPYDSANGEWHEFGLFGGSTATADKDSGLMINRKVHDPIIKSSNLQVERNIIFTF